MKCRHKPPCIFSPEALQAVDDMGPYWHYKAGCSCGWKHTATNSTVSFAIQMWEYIHMKKLLSYD